MRRVQLPFEPFLNYPSRSGQSLQSTTAGVRSWGDVYLQKGTYAEREAISSPQPFDLFLQTDHSAVLDDDGVDQDPAGLYFYYNAWTPVGSLYCPANDKYYPAKVVLLEADETQPQFGFLSPR